MIGILVLAAKCLISGICLAAGFCWGLSYFSDRFRLRITEPVGKIVEEDVDSGDPIHPPKVEFKEKGSSQQEEFADKKKMIYVN